MTLEININLGNAAFDGDAGPSEVCRILRKLADDVDRETTLTGFSVTLRDINGNRVGEAATQVD